MSKTIIPRAVVVVIAAAISGMSRKKGDVLLVPEDVGTDAARDLMRMARPRVEAASEEQTTKRLKAYRADKAEREAAEKAERDAAEKAARDKADAAAQLIADAEAKAEEIIKAAEAKAEEITKAAEAKAEEIAKAAKPK